MYNNFEVFSESPLGLHFKDHTVEMCPSKHGNHYVVYINLKKAGIKLPVSAIHEEYLKQNLAILDENLDALLERYNEIDNSINTLLEYSIIRPYIIQSQKI